VVGTQDGTSRVKDGDRVRVDGTTGTVDILERAAQFREDLMRA
jgi:phosphohistidine swiveling domain-containing protein